jgi:DNA-binding NarL/FixJ family response regulator
MTAPVSQGITSDQSLENQLQAQRDGNQNGLVLEMFQQGKSRVEIAKELGLGVGEVKLVLDLYQK